MSYAQKRRRKAKKGALIQWIEDQKTKPTIEECRLQAKALLPEDKQHNVEECAAILLRFWDTWYSKPKPYTI